MKDGQTYQNSIIFITCRCLSYLPTAVGSNPAHFDISLARSAVTDEHNLSTDWLVLHLQELVSLSYQVVALNWFLCYLGSLMQGFIVWIIYDILLLQISTSQFEGMQSIGVRVLSIIMDKVS